MIQLEPHTEGYVLPVKAQPGASSNAIRGIWNGMLKISVTAAPEKGKANEAIIGFLAKQLHLSKSQIEILSGATDSRKRFLLRTTAAEEITARINALLAD